MNTITKHSASPSYLGDPTQFSFPNPTHSLKMNSQEKLVERAGSIFIKSIPKVLPFPKNDLSTDSSGSTETKFNITLEERNIHKFNTFDESQMNNKTSILKDNLIAKRPSLRPVNSTKQSKSPTGYLRSSLLQKYHEQLATGKVANDFVALEVDDNTLDNVTKLNSIRSLQTLRSVRSKKSLDIIVLHREDSFQNSVSSNFSEKHLKEEERVEEQIRKTGYHPALSNKITEHHNHSPQTPERNASRRLKPFENIPEQEVVVDHRRSNSEQNLTSDIDLLEIPRRSSKRLRRNPSTLTSRSRKYRKSNTSVRGTRLNGSSIKSIKTLASEIQTDLHKNRFKSVDFANLDLLLQELLELSDEKTSLESLVNVADIKNKRQNSFLSGKIFNDVHENNESMKVSSRVSSTKFKSGHNGIPSVDTEISEFQIIKPFELRNSLNRRISVKRNLSVFSKEIKQISTGKENPKLNENTRDCELKRSNAVKRKPRIVELLINLLSYLKKASKKVWYGINRNSKRITFRKQSIKKNSAEDKKISKPILIDVNKTPFRTEVLSQNDTPIDSRSKLIASKKVSTKSVNSLSTIDSEGFDIDGVEKDQLVVLWKHYLSNSIVNRVDMKLEANNAIHLERVKSSQSTKSKKKSIAKIETEQVDRLLSRYVGSIASSNESSTSGPLSLTGLSKGSTSSFDTEEINQTFDKVLFGDNESLSPTYSTFLCSKNRNVSSTSSWSTLSTDKTNSLTSVTPSDTDSDTEHSSISTIEEEDSSYHSQSRTSSISSHEDTEEQFSFVHHGKPIATENIRLSSLKHSPNMIDLHSFHTARSDYSHSPSRTSSTFSFQPSVY
ncbi:hypothetical protein CANINC_004372 [Pichia inconspicua]|uniref:Uncharacterized protein n=1 Tax=Pichia inconspicua TaxID=52247 RepID=A0A4T0WW42_9ASCO|nr:hypothetical protein CANINC_004372 [[Candida] inconspicua]